MRRNALALLAVTGAVALVAAACGGGGSGGDGVDNEYADAFATSRQGSSSDNGTAISDDDAACVGNRVTEVFGAEALQNAGLTPDAIRAGKSLDDVFPEPTQEQADGLADALFECLDMGGLVAASLKAGAEEDGVILEDADSKFDCIGEEFEESATMRDALARSILTGEDPDFENLDSDAQALVELLGECLSVQDLVSIGQQTSE